MPYITLFWACRTKQVNQLVDTSCMGYLLVGMVVGRRGRGAMQPVSRISVHTDLNMLTNKVHQR